MRGRWSTFTNVRPCSFVVRAALGSRNLGCRLAPCRHAVNPLDIEQLAVTSTFAAESTRAWNMGSFTFKNCG